MYNNGNSNIFNRDDNDDDDDDYVVMSISMLIV